MSDADILTNNEFDYPFAGKTYKVKKATLKQVIDFQRKQFEIANEKDPAGDLRMASYAIYVILHSIDPTITEDFVTDNAQGDMDFMDVIAKLGFMSQQKVEMMNRLRNSLELPSIGKNSTV